LVDQSFTRKCFGKIDYGNTKIDPELFLVKENRIFNIEPLRKFQRAPQLVEPRGLELVLANIEKGQLLIVPEQVTQKHHPMVI
jgi:hypothetical protein